jgi:F-type H+-transporting ATPase subunit delta
MQISKAAKRYAIALLELTEEQKITAQVQKDFSGLLASLNESKDLQNLFESPVIPNGKKSELVRALFKGKMQPLSFQFLELLVHKNREQMIREVLAAYEEAYNEMHKIALAKIESAMALSDAEKKKLLDGLKKQSGYTIEPTYEVNKALKGGVKIQIKDTILDGTVLHKLKRLEQEFSSHQ